MRASELLSAFIAFEEREHLFERAARGVRYWQAIRHDVFQETLQAAGLAERAHLRVEELPLSSWLPAQLRALPETLRRSAWTFAPRATSGGTARATATFTGIGRADLLVANHPRHVLSAGRYICPYSQPLLDATRRSRVVLEGQFQGRYATPIPEQPTAYIDLALLAAHAEFRVHAMRGGGLSQRELDDLGAIRDRLSHAVGAAPPIAAVVRRARTAVIATNGLWPRYERLLDRVQPKLIVVVIGYRLVNQVLTQVAHTRGLPVAELQHGALGETHPAYNFARARRPESFPDHLLLFGELWREATPGLPLPAAQTPAIGYAWLEQQKERYGRESPRSPRRVLFLSQRTIGAQLARVAVAVRERVPASELHITYRLHPSEAAGWREAYPELAAADIDVQDAPSSALYAAQRDSDAQVGVYSTALIEGLAFGLPSYVMALPGHEQLGAITAAGAAQLVPDADALVEALRAPAKGGAANLDALWAKGATGAFERFVEHALE